MLAMLFLWSRNYAWNERWSYITRRRPEVSGIFLAFFLLIDGEQPWPFDKKWNFSFIYESNQNRFLPIRRRCVRVCKSYNADQDKRKRERGEKSLSKRYIDSKISSMDNLWLEKNFERVVKATVRCLITFVLEQQQQQTTLISVPNYYRLLFSSHSYQESTKHKTREVSKRRRRGKNASVMQISPL